MKLATQIHSAGWPPCRCSRPCRCYGGVAYTGFFSAQVFLNLLIDNAFLVIVAVGMTFVILSGGIDLSVGSVVALTTMVLAALVEHHHWSLWVAIPLVLLHGHGCLAPSWAG